MNLYDFLPPDDEELVTSLLDNKKLRIERIVSTGQTTGWYDQSQTEFVTLLEGRAEIEYTDGRIVTLRRGDTLLLASHEKHRVRATSTDPPCVWLCVFF